MRPHRLLPVLATAVLALTLSACKDNTAAPNTGERLVIGVSGAQPGLSMKTADGFEGFDIDVASYVANHLGWSNSEIEFKQVATADRISALTSGEVDMVVDAFSITDERKQQIAFAGPYFTAGQDLLVGAENADITGPHTLDGKTLCSAKGTTSAETIMSPEFSEGTTLRELANDDACVAALLAGEVDAVTTDDVVLAGFVQEHPGLLKVLGSPFSTEYYGIGLPLDSPDVGVVNDVINDMVADGTWKSDFDEWFAKSGYNPPMPPSAGQ